VLVVTFDGQTFSFAFDIADPAQLSALLRELDLADGHPLRVFPARQIIHAFA
jgi:hypothetical protein